MNKMDPDEEEEDEDGNPIKRDKTREEAPPTKSNSTKSAQVRLLIPFRIFLYLKKYKIKICNEIYPVNNHKTLLLDTIFHSFPF